MIKVNKTDKMRYQPNSITFWLCILSIIANCCYFVSIYRNNALSYTYYLGADVVMNIVYMLVSFLCAEKGKAYSKGFSVVMAVLALSCLLRMFFLPAHYRGVNELVGEAYTMAIVYLAIAGVTMAIAAIVNYIKSARLERYLKSIGEAE